jgi:hypothetical protein
VKVPYPDPVPEERKEDIPVPGDGEWRPGKICTNLVKPLLGGGKEEKNDRE